MICKNAVWLIIGCSRGFGRALAQQALHSTYRVVVTARDLSTVDDLVKAHSETALGVELDVTKPGQIKAAITAAEDRFGSVDVLVNNAGYGYFGAIEEGEDAGVRAVFEANVFGPVNLVKAVLPGMRARKHGHIVNISSVGGMVTYPAASYYHMTNFALDALSETLAKEVSPFGVGVTVVEPGAFLTDFRASTPEKQTVCMLVPAHRHSQDGTVTD
jgi:NAD(P)-dependent dehydrogenase (short-subunit alcohol dehydrogenase family)